MIRFLFDERLLVLMTRRNIEKLINGEPFFFKFTDKELAMKINEICIFFAENKLEGLKELQKLGVQIPHELFKDAERNPL